jgi:hypothetical protein
VFVFLRWLEGLGSSRELLLWVALSIALYVVSAHLAWRTRHLETGLLGENIRWLDTWRFRSLAGQLVRFLFYVVIPYGLLVQRHLLTGRSMGLVGAEPDGFLAWTAIGWLRGAGWALLWGLVGAAAVGGSWWALARRLDSETVFYLHHRPPVWQLFWDALFLQVHWGFYRAAAGAWLKEPEPYWSVFLGLALVGLEAAGDPSLYFDRQWPSSASGWVRLAAVAWTTGVLFLFTRNLWLGVVVHWGMTWTLNLLGDRLSRSSLAASAESG